MPTDSLVLNAWRILSIQIHQKMLLKSTTCGAGGNMRTIYILAALILLLIGAHAESEKIRQFKAREEEFLAVDVQRLNKTCASSITVKFDWSDVSEVDLVTYGAENHCDRALGGIERVCVDAVGRNAVRKQIATVICGFSPQRSVWLKDRVLRYKIHFKSYNDALSVSEYLQNNL